MPPSGALGGGVKKVSITVVASVGAKPVHVSWFPGTESDVVQALIRQLLKLPADALMLAINADDDAPCQHDAFPLCNAVPSGAALRLLSQQEWEAMPTHRRSSVDVGLNSSAPSFLKHHIDSLTRCDSSLVPTVQCTVHVQAIVEIDPRSETFGVHFTLMLDWCDEQLAGMRKDDIEEIITDSAQYAVPRVQIANLVEGGDELEVAQPRCDNSSKGLVKITAKLKAILQSSMDVHRFPFDSQRLCIETHLRSITLDKANLYKGEATRLYIPLEDPGRVSIKKRAHQIVVGADKVHEWAFTCERERMHALCEAYLPKLQEYEQLQARLSKHASQVDVRMQKMETEVIEEVRKVEPRPKPVYQAGASMPHMGTHVVAFELTRHAASVMWTLTLPVFLVTTLSFCQFGVDYALLADRLSVTLTCILTVVAFQYVVREMVPAVPYRTVMDNFILISLAVMFVQSFASLAVAILSGAYSASRRGVSAVGAGLERSNALLELLVKASSTTDDSLKQALAATDTQSCDTRCENANLLDEVARFVLCGSWVIACSSFLFYAHRWSCRIAWYRDMEFKPRANCAATEQTTASGTSKHVARRALAMVNSSPGLGNQRKQRTQLPKLNEGKVAPGPAIEVEVAALDTPGVHEAIAVPSAVAPSAAAAAGGETPPPPSGTVTAQARASPMVTDV